MESLSPWINWINPIPLLQIDGSFLEGGGQILRIAVSFAYLFNKPITISNIRGNRTNQGLQAQHLACAQCITSVYQSNEILGFAWGSNSIHITPTPLLIDSKSTTIVCSCSSAGSIGWMIQQMLPSLLFTNVTNDPNNEGNPIFFTLKLTGGTLTKFSPSIDYLINILFPILSKYIHATPKTIIKKQGLYPRGGGEVEMQIPQILTISPIVVRTRGKLLKAKIIFKYTDNFNRVKIGKTVDSIYKNVKKMIRKVCESSGINEYNSDFIELDEEKLSGKYSFTFFYEMVLEYENTIVSAEHLFSDKKENAELAMEIESNCIEKSDFILSNTNICFDEFTVDHWIIFMALAKGTSVINIGKVSLHTETVIEVIKMFLKDIKIKVTCNGDNDNVIEIVGINYTRSGVTLL